MKNYKFTFIIFIILLQKGLDLFNMFLKGKYDSYAAVIGAVGSVLSLIYFLMAMSTKGFSTVQMMQIGVFLVANVTLMIVGFLDINTSTTYFLPFGMTILGYLFSAYIYFNNYASHSGNASSRWWYMTSVGHAVYSLICVVCVLIAYLGLIEKMKGYLLGMMLTSGLFGGYAFNVIVNIFQKIYSYTAASELSSSMATPLKTMLISVLQYAPYLFALAGIICLQYSAMKKKEEKSK